MKILHTADVHLKTLFDQRWLTLREILELGKARAVDALLISGDLFDRESDAAHLRPKIREMFTDCGFAVFILPGNHDMEAYRRGAYFGKDVRIIDDFRSPLEYRGANFWGLPYEFLPQSEILERIRFMSKNLDRQKVNILLFHGELTDLYFSRGDFGDEGKERYMPVRLSYFRDSGFDYVCAGHFHSSFDVFKLENGGHFVYPGSPLALSKRELGRRKVNLFETGREPREHPLDSPHYEGIVVELDPISSTDPLKEVVHRLKDLHASARVILTVSGYISSKTTGMSEGELAERLDRVLGDRCEEKRYEFKDVEEILGDELFMSFNEKLEKKGFDDRKKAALREAVMRAMIDART